MESPGDLLREARRRKGLSPEEVFRQTRVRPVLLDQLEEDVLSALPEDPYGRSLYRMVAAAVGADVERVLAAYDELLELRGEAVREPEEEPPQPRRKPVGIILAVGALALLAGALFILGRSGGPGTMQVEEVPHQPAELALDETASPPPPVMDSGSVIPGPGPAVASAGTDRTATPVKATPIPNPQEEEELGGDGEGRRLLLLNSDLAPEGITAERPQLVLGVRAVFETWIWVKSDGSRIRQGMLQAGEGRVWRASEEFLMILGRYDGVELTLNGRPVIVPTSSSGVVSFRLSWEELAAEVNTDDSGPP